MDVAYLGRDLRAEDMSDARDGEDERLGRLDPFLDPGLHLLDLPLDEVYLLHEQFDLKERVRVPLSMPHDSLAMPLISSAFSRPSLPRLARESVLPRASTRTPRHSSGVGHFLRNALEALPEGVGKDGIVLGKYLVQRHYHLALEVGDALLETLVKPCELAQLYHRLVSELAGAKLAKAQGVGYEDAVDEVGFDPRAPLKRRIASVRMGLMTTTS